MKDWGKTTWKKHKDGKNKGQTMVDEKGKRLQETTLNVKVNPALIKQLSEMRNLGNARDNRIALLIELKEIDDVNYDEGFITYKGKRYDLQYN